MDIRPSMICHDISSYFLDDHKTHRISPLQQTAPPQTYQGSSTPAHQGSPPLYNHPNIFDQFQLHRIMRFPGGNNTFPSAHHTPSPADCAAGKYANFHQSDTRRTPGESPIQCPNPPEAPLVDHVQMAEFTAAKFLASMQRENNQRNGGPLRESQYYPYSWSPLERFAAYNGWQGVAKYDASQNTHLYNAKMQSDKLNNSSMKQHGTSSHLKQSLHCATAETTADDSIGSPPPVLTRQPSLCENTHSPGPSAIQYDDLPSRQQTSFGQSRSPEALIGSEVSPTTPAAPEQQCPSQSHPRDTRYPRHSEGRKIAQRFHPYYPAADPPSRRKYTDFSIAAILNLKSSPTPMSSPSLTVKPCFVAGTSGVPSRGNFRVASISQERQQAKIWAPPLGQPDTSLGPCVPFSERSRQKDGPHHSSPPSEQLSMITNSAFDPTQTETAPLSSFSSVSTGSASTLASCSTEVSERTSCDCPTPPAVCPDYQEKFSHQQQQQPGQFEDLDFNIDHPQQHEYFVQNVGQPHHRQYLLDHLANDAAEEQTDSSSTPTPRPGAPPSASSSSSNENPPPTKRARKTRTRLPSQVVHYLESVFDASPYLTPTQRTNIAKDVGLEEEPIRYWWQTRRSKWRRENNCFVIPRTTANNNEPL